MNAQEILDIPTNRPELLFGSGDVQKQFRNLLKEWHPDVCRDPRATEVTAHITRLRTAAETHSQVSTDTLTLHGKDRKTRNIKFRRRDSFELGDYYYGDGVVAYVLNPGNQTFAARAHTTLSTLHFADGKMKDEIGRYLPTVKSRFETADGQSVLVFEKRARTYTLFDLMVAMGGTVPPEHVAWIISSLLNLCCYLGWARMSHGDISIDTVFVDPEKHAVHLLGGWWYAEHWGETLTHLPMRTVNLAPRRVMTAKKVEDSVLDLTMVKMIGRELLGFPTGQNPPQGTPLAMVDFLRQPPHDSALAEYRFWMDTILPASFGERRFVKLDITDDAVFKQGV